MAQLQLHTDQHRHGPGLLLPLSIPPLLVFIQGLQSLQVHAEVFSRAMLPILLFQALPDQCILFFAVYHN